MQGQPELTYGSEVPLCKFLVKIWSELCSKFEVLMCKFLLAAYFFEMSLSYHLHDV
jgi:hypothetical protein